MSPAERSCVNFLQKPNKSRICLFFILLWYSNHCFNFHVCLSAFMWIRPSIILQHSWKAFVIPTLERKNFPLLKFQPVCMLIRKMRVYSRLPNRHTMFIWFWCIYLFLLTLLLCIWMHGVSAKPVAWFTLETNFACRNVA